MTNYLVSINNIEDIKKYKEVGIDTFLFALKDYSVGYPSSFSTDEINSINENKYVLINELLDNDKLDKLKQIIGNIKCKGIIFEDISLINVLKGLDIEKILFINHFNCNYESINYWLSYVDSVFVSNELTYEEIKDITEKVNKKVVLHVFGYNEIMYSKRDLLSNYYKYNGLDPKYKNTIEDKATKIKFHAIEDKNGTVFFSENIFDGRRLLDLNKVLYFYINSTFLKVDDVINFINGNKVDNTDEGFLNKKTIYKLK